jgi:hypothetical protein
MYGTRCSSLNFAAIPVPLSASTTVLTLNLLLNNFTMFIVFQKVLREEDGLYLM